MHFKLYKHQKQQQFSAAMLSSSVETLLSSPLSLSKAPRVDFELTRPAIKDQRRWCQYNGWNHCVSIATYHLLLTRLASVHTPDCSCMMRPQLTAVLQVISRHRNQFWHSGIARSRGDRAKSGNFAMCDS